VTSLLLLGLVVVMVVGHGGPPNIGGQPTAVQIEFAAIGLMLLGLLIGWLREGFGGLLVILGLAVFNIVELAVNGRPALGASRRPLPAWRASWRVPRAVAGERSAVN
jgi:hypothetical protein